MLFSHSWLAELVDGLPEDPERIAEWLTALGLAVESRQEAGEDVVYDVEVTPNRPDCLGHYGIARELAVATGGRLTDLPEPLESDPDAAASGSVPVTIDPAAAEDCRRYVGVLIEGVENRPSPEWMQRRLRAIGLRPINCVVDVTNYVLWETGQPLHAFDVDRLAGPAIGVRRAAEGEELTTLDGERRTLRSGMLLITDAERPIALAGVIGGADSEVEDSTTRILIESAHFAPGAVRRAARELDLATDASHRFERGVDPEICLVAATRAATLVAELTGGRLMPPPADVRSGSRLRELRGRLEHERLEAFAGFPVAVSEVERILAGLGFRLEAEGDGVWRVEVPSWRYFDFERTDGRGEVWEADLFEEVLRQVGFDRIPSALPVVAGPDAESAPAAVRRGRLRAALQGLGFHEAVSYAFGSAEEAERFPARVGGAPARLTNPISQRYAVLRRSLLPGLVESARFNLNRGASEVRLFEIGDVFGEAGARVEESETVAVLQGGEPSAPWDRRQTPDLFTLKGSLEAVAGGMGLAIEFRPTELPGWVPGTAAEILPAGGNEPIGCLGQVDDAELPAAVFAAELELDAAGAEDRFVEVEIPPRHPGVHVDLTLTHSTEVAWRDLSEAIRSLAGDHLVGFRLRDRYSGEGVPAGCVNTTIGFFYQSPERSLTQEEVNTEQDRLREQLERRFGAGEEGA